METYMTRRFGILLILSVVVLIGCRDKRVSVPDEMPWHQGTFAEARAEVGDADRQIMIFFETEW